MAVPQTAAQIALMMQAFDARAADFRDRILVPYQSRLMDMICRRVIRRRPHTDDMFQMLQDLGIEPPEKNFTPPNGLTFHFSGYR